MQNISYQSLYTNVLNLVFTKVVYLLRKQHVSVHCEKRPCKIEKLMRTQRTNSTFASPDIQADSLACKRAIFLTTHATSINDILKFEKMLRG